MAAQQGGAGGDNTTGEGFSALDDWCISVDLDVLLDNAEDFRVSVGSSHRNEF